MTCGLGVVDCCGVLVVVTGGGEVAWSLELSAELAGFYWVRVLFSFLLI